MGKSHLRFEHVRAVAIDGLHPLPRREHGAAAVDGACEVGLGDVPVTAADGVGVAVVGFLVDQTSCLRMAGMRLFAACDGGGGEDDEEQECWNLAKEHGSRFAGGWVRRVVEVGR